MKVSPVDSTLCSVLPRTIVSNLKACSMFGVAITARFVKFATPFTKLAVFLGTLLESSSVKVEPPPLATAAEIETPEISVAKLPSKSRSLSFGCPASSDPVLVSTPPIKEIGWSTISSTVGSAWRTTRPALVTPVRPVALKTSL